MYELLPNQATIMIDLHGKSVAETKKILAEQFALIEERNITEFYIITGRGNHVNADGSRGVLKNILPKLLKAYSQHVVELNPESGAYKVKLHDKMKRSPLHHLYAHMFSNDDLAKSLQQSIEQENKDDIESLLNLAYIHLLGQIPHFSDPRKAITLLERAKQQGAIEAYILLGNHYLEQGDYKRAISHFEYAVAKNDPIAQLALAKCYLLGQGVKQDDKKAVELLTAAAEQGQPYAQSNLGRSYYIGEYTPQNSELAVKYLTQASNQGISESKVLLARCYATGDGVPKNILKAFELYQEAARMNDIFALYQVGEYLLDGRSGSQPSIEKALPYFLKAAELGDGDSQAKVASLYLFSPVRDITKGMIWLKKSLDQNNRFACYLMSHVYSKAIGGVPKDEAKAYELMKRSADMNFPAAQYEMAVMLVLGINRAVKQNKQAGLAWLKKSADQHYQFAIIALNATNSSTEEILQKQYNAAHREQKTSEDSIVEAALAGDIIAQLRALKVVTQELLTPQVRAQLIDKFWNQSAEAILAIDDNQLKYMIIDMYFNRGDLSTAEKTKLLQILSQLSDQQDPQALLRLGAIFMTGRCGTRDSSKALTYWQKGAELDDPDCLNSLGYFYEEKGQVDPLAFQKAFSLHQKAAILGNANSYNQLGLLYNHGKGVKKNITEAIRCFEQAMLIDEKHYKNPHRKTVMYNPVYPYAAFNLGMLYFMGDDGLAEDFAKAIDLLKLAAEANHPEAIKILQKIESKYNQRLNESRHKNSFWQSTDQSIKQQKDPKTVLQELTTALGITVIWNITNHDQAWCYIKPDQTSLLEKYMLNPFALRKTTDQRTILMLENISRFDINKIVNEIISQHGQNSANVHKP